MIKRLINYLRRKFLRHRLQLVTNERNRYDNPTLENVVQLSNILDLNLLRQCTHDHIERIILTMYSKRCTEIIDSLSYVVEKIGQKSYMEDALFPLSYDYWAPNLDDYMTNVNNESISIIEYQVALKKMIDAFYDALESCDDSIYKDYYIRKTTYLVRDLYEIEEGMILSSLIEL
jgi:hypothetical protein